MQLSLFRIRQIILALFVALLFAFAANAQTTTFNYQGRLTDNMSAASGTYQMQFALYDALNNGSQIGSTIENPSVIVNNGVFTVQLDYGAAAFPGAERFLEISVRRNSNETYTTLTPRQRITSAPYSIRALNAGTADNATSLGGTAANQFVQTNDSRLSDERAPSAGSSNYIQNTATQQSASFNISGNGTAGGTLSANAVNSSTQYNIGGSRILSIVGSANLFAGTAAGASYTTGGGNAFFGSNAGANNTSGCCNSFFGSSAGQSNTTAGGNSFFGREAGLTNTTGFQNSFFGSSAGERNTTGANNAFVGRNAGVNNSSGGNNAFFGTSAGGSNTEGSNNTIIGGSSNVGAGNLTYATAIGSGVVVSTSNTVVLGRNVDTVQIPGTLSQACRSGFTAISGGRLCISAMQSANTFFNAVQVCTNLQARVGNSADAMLSFSLSGFNYFGGLSSGWLADHAGDDVWGTWNVTTAPSVNFDGPFLNAASTNLPYRCVY